MNEIVIPDREFASEPGESDFSFGAVFTIETNRLEADIAWASGVEQIGILLKSPAIAHAVDTILFSALSEAAFADDWNSAADAIYDNA